ncbi:MAG: RluA family pseudouridine synthase [Clostridia bacterium]|nr:RluA family pseudouridine synthase [Clostridia bacterium]
MEFTVQPDQNGELLSRVLHSEADDVPSRVIKEAIKTRSIKVDGKRIGEDVPLCAGQRVQVFWSKSYLKTLERRETLPIIYEDAHILVLDKPAGLICQSEQGQATGNNALDMVKKYQEQKGKDPDMIHLCHRLDVMTGGLLLFALDEETYEAALKAFEDRTIKKVYTCEVKGCPSRKEALLTGWLRKDEKIARVSITDYKASGSQMIETEYRVLQPGETSLLEVNLLTGRTHQIRAHLAHIGHPILGDDKYGDRELNRTLGIRYQRLWATRLFFHADGALSYLNGKTITTNYPYGGTK